MRKIGTVLLIIAALIVCLAILTFLQPQAFFPNQVFVSEDATQKVELKVNSRPNSVIPATASVLSGGRLFGKQVGLYTLETNGVISAGEFVWLKGPFCCRQDDSQTLVFRPNSGKEWSVTFQQDGTFQDSSGITWRLTSRE
jgi:hypothetical protein